MELYNPENLMRLDRAAQSALHVFPARTGSTVRSSNSIYGILNHSRTAMGKRLLRSWLKQPLTEVAAIQERHTIVKVFVDDLQLRCASPLPCLCCMKSTSSSPLFVLVVLERRPPVHVGSLVVMHGAFTNQFSAVANQLDHVFA